MERIISFTRSVTAAGLLALASASAVQAQDLQSAGALAFDTSNTLFVGDGKAGLVHAFDLSDVVSDQSAYQLGRAQTFEGRTIFNNLDVEIAGLLGVAAKDVVINDMVVHKPGKQVFLSVHRGRGPEAEAVIIAVDNGSLELVDLGDAAHSAMSVGPVPTAETLEFGQPLNTLAITDIDYYNGELLVAGVSNEEFSSKLRRIPFPFADEISTSSIEIWHAVNAQYETRAPIISQTVAELNGEPTLIAIYACTPIVRIPLSALTDGAEVRGRLIGEMGFGNTPLDIVPYTNAWDGSENVVVTNTNRSAAALPLQAVATAEEMPHGEGVQPVFSVAGVYQFPLPMSGTMHLDTLDENFAVVIRTSPDDPRNIQLHTLPLPFFFDRADHVVEENWEDGPDPFGYPWAHRALVFRVLKSLGEMIDISIVHWFMGKDGWTFVPVVGATPDHLHGAEFLHQVYTKADPNYSGRVTVPVLWDKAQNTIVSNESAEIIRMFNSAFDGIGAAPGDYYPEAERDEIAALNARIYDTVNNGVYKAGFATTQEAYEDAVVPLFQTLDWLEDRLSHQRYLMGDHQTEADWRLWTTLLRFDPVYVGHFKCNLRRIADYPNLSNFVRDLYQVPGITQTVDLDYIKKYYYGSHESVNPTRVVPMGPEIDYAESHDRAKFSKETAA